ncbi:hypothetical protein [Pseudomonas sp. NFX98]|uniref:hypothetical protein n=1 Tax=Pseudomonas sp. NFX98 TaxID=3399122 RepID=UPI0039FD925C
MNDNVNGVRGEVSEYTWGRMWSDGTKEFNNGAIQYADGSLEFDGLTFYVDGVVIDVTGRQVGLTAEEETALAEVEPTDDAPDDAESVEQEGVEDTTNPTDEVQTLIIEDEDDAEIYIPLGSDER